MQFDWAFLAGDKVAPKLLAGLVTTLELFAVAWIGGFKDTSLAMVIGVADLTYQVKAIENLTFRSLEVFSVATAAYLALSLVLMAIAAGFGRRFPPAAKR